MAFQALLTTVSVDFQHAVNPHRACNSAEPAWLREMTKEEIKQVGETGPTIDSIEVAEFESHDAIKEWLSKKAPAFLR